MNNTDIFKYIDHTLLKPTFLKEDLLKLLDETIKYKFASACIPPCAVKFAKDYVKDKAKICTVVGFPLGYNSVNMKCLETEEVINNGADEVDMVINLHFVKNKRLDLIEEEIVRIREISKNQILKVIVETCYLNEDEKIKLCEIITKVGADFIKTSTGFGSGGATFSDIDLFRKYIGKNVQMKAAGGIKTIEEVNTYIEKGVTRIGTSSIIKMLK